VSVTRRFDRSALNFFRIGRNRQHPPVEREYSVIDEGLSALIRCFVGAQRLLEVRVSCSRARADARGTGATKSAILLLSSTEFACDYRHFAIFQS
jgi:hypothetical protein